MRFLFGNYSIDAGRRELRRDGKAVHVEPQVFDLILHLVRNRDHVVSKDDLLANVWNGRIVSESTLSNRINAARRALGDSGEQQQFIKTIARRGLRFLGEVREEKLDSPSAAVAAVPLEANGPQRPAVAPQEVTFCRTPDGVNLAVATSGNGMPVVKAANWLNHIEFDWLSPVWSPLLNLLSEKFRLVRYDERATGLSDWDVKDISFDAVVADLETVVDKLELDKFALFGVSQGAAVSIAYATRHPHRVSRLVLFGGYAQGWLQRGDPEEIAQRKALLTLIRNGWGLDNPAFRQVFTSRFVPGATGDEMKWFNDLQRVSASAENAIRLIEMFSRIDVTQLLSRVTVPTLVLHSRGDAGIPFSQGLMLARGIPNAHFVALESDNHLILSHEPAWDRYTQEICDFLSETEPE
jgi:DNA-binding winged helix-turn-helix (wHTH) protein/alpha-beta hydrolase superfamily lysophospholipase